VATDSRILERLETLIAARRGADPTTSWVAKLNAKGLDAVLKKIGEEATEVVMAGKEGDRLRIVGETADFWFHCLIMLAHYGLRPSDVLMELRRREGISGIDEKATRKDNQRIEAERK
jgi:phosphoribosyl-ATP pyrophosphohydrolase